MKLYAQARPEQADFLTLRHAEALCGLRILAARRQEAQDSEETRAAAVRAADRLRAFAKLTEGATPPKNVDAETLRRWAAEAIVLAVEVLGSEDVADYENALKWIDQNESRLAEFPALRGRLLACRIQCYRGLGKFDRATAAIRDLVEQADTQQVGRVLIDLVEAMETQVEQLRWQGRQEQAKALAAGGVETTVQLLRWFESQPERAEHVGLVEATLAKLLVYAGRPGEAMPILDKHLADDPHNGELVRLQALALEQQAERDGWSDELRDQAEHAWGQLMSDPTLRDRAPRYYWESLEHWLGLRLTAGDAEGVIRRIEQERIWWPGLGGRDTKERIIDLLRTAREQTTTTQPADATP
jgi:tetratricopeptide (TPR) repeat protein